MREIKLITVFAIIGVAVAAVLALAGCSGEADPSVQPTGPYSTQGMSGMSCLHTGPGWITENPMSGPDLIFHVKDAYYCAVSTVAEIIPVTGKPFDTYNPFTFSTIKPQG